MYSIQVVEVIVPYSLFESFGSRVRFFLSLCVSRFRRLQMGFMPRIIEPQSERVSARSCVFHAVASLDYGNERVRVAGDEMTEELI